MVAVANTLVGPMRMTDECGPFRTAISLLPGRILIALLDVPGPVDWRGHPTIETHMYYADDAVLSRLQNELSAMVKAGRARQAQTLAERTYFV